MTLVAGSRSSPSTYQFADDGAMNSTSCPDSRSRAQHGTAKAAAVRAFRPC